MKAAGSARGQRDRRLRLAVARRVAALQAAPLELRHGMPPPAGRDNAELAVIFVCHGNICRSPMAAGSLRAHLTRRGLGDRVFVDSAGTSRDNVGRRADGRARLSAVRRTGSIAAHRARQFEPSDFDTFDLVLVMDELNRFEVLALARSDRDRAKVRLVLEAAGGGEVRDPVRGSRSEFRNTFAEIDRACRVLAEEIEQRLSALASLR